MAVVPTIVVVVWVLVYRTKTGNERTVEFTDKRTGKEYRDKLIARGFEILSWGVATAILFFVDMKTPFIAQYYPDWILRMVA